MLRKFISIAKAEIEDLKEDFHSLLGECQKRKDRGELTDYVFMENCALLRNQARGVDNLLEELGKIEGERFADIKALQKEMINRLAATVTRLELPTCLFDMVSRRLQKVIKYMESI